MDLKQGHAGTAAVLSFVFNGLGQLYNGQISKGLWIIFFSAVAMVVFLIGAILTGLWLLGMLPQFLLIAGLVLFLLGLITLCIIGIYSIRDAYRTAKDGL